MKPKIRCPALLAAAFIAVVVPGALAAASRPAGKAPATAAPATASSRGALIGTWVPAGPLGGDVVALASAPPSHAGLVYGASAYGFVLRTFDGGSSWTLAGRVAPGLDAGLPGFNRIEQLVVDPSDPATVFAASSEGLFRSSDGGVNWTQLPAGAGGVDAVAVAPSNPAVVYALTASDVLRSRNHGARFRPVGRGQLPFSLRSVAVDPADFGRVYVGTDHGLFRSTDNGASWTAASGPSAPGGLVGEVLVLPDSTVVAVADFPSGGVVLSNDGGDSWRDAFNGLPSFPGSPLSPTAVVRSGAGAFYAYYADTGEVFRSNRRLRRWVPAASLAPFFPPSSAFPVLSMAADSSTDVVYAGVAAAGVLRNDTAGGRWLFDDDGVSLHEVQQVVTAPPVGGAPPTALLLARSDRQPDLAAEQVFFYLTPDLPPPNGWFDLPRVDGVARRIAFDPVTRTVYAGSDFGISRSIGFATPWLPAAPGQITGQLVDLGVAAGPPGNVFAFSAAGHALCGATTCHTLSLFATTDGGASWSARGSTSDPDDPAAPPGPVRGQLVLDPTAPATLYLVSSGLYKSTDAGATLQALPLPGFGAALALDPTAPATLYAALRPGAGALVYKSADGGSTWSPAGSGLPADAEVSALALDPVHPSVLYLATDQGVFATFDGAATWAVAGQGLEGLNVLSLAIWVGPAGPNGPSSVPLAGTEGAGLFLLRPGL